jgi:hypothetical protein
VRSPHAGSIHTAEALGTIAEREEAKLIKEDHRRRRCTTRLGSKRSQATDTISIVESPCDHLGLRVVDPFR